MAHKLINGKVVVDWTTGDPEGDRLTLLAAYRLFIKEIRVIAHEGKGCVADLIMQAFEKWKIDTENQIDEVPRIWISKPD